MPDALTPKDFETDMFDDEPRIGDWKLAQALGFVRAYDIHELIDRHQSSLQEFGNCPYRTGNSVGAGRRGREYRLNFNQAIFIAIKSEAPNAIAVQIHVVMIYGEWAHGKLKPVDAETTERIAEATVDAKQRAPDLLAALEEMLTAALTDTTDIRGRLESVQRTALDIQDRLGDIVKRRPAPVRNQDIYDRVISDFYNGRCPCCNRTNRVIIDDDGKRTADYHLDHATDNPYKNGLHEMWAVCGKCNHDLTRKAGYRAFKMDEFRVFQHRVEDVIGNKLI